MSGKKKPSGGQAPVPAAPAPAPEPEPATPLAGLHPKRRRAIYVGGGCAAVFAVALLAAFIAINAWDARDSRLFKGNPLPSNVAYIGHWVSDKTVGACISTFALAGDRIACDFVLRNDSNRDMTVQEIGRTIIAPALDVRMSEMTVEADLMQGDQPMRVTDDENVLGLTQALGGVWLMIDPGHTTPSKTPQPFTLKPGQVKQIRYRPRMDRSTMMPASALRIAVRLDDGSAPHAFYFLRKSCGIGGWFEKKVETAVENAR